MSDDEKKRTWTSEKLDWLRCLSVDSCVKPGMFEVAFAIIQHVNARRRVAILSDRVISDATSISSSEVYRHRIELKKFGWIDWERARAGLIIRPLFGRMNAMLDELESRRQNRECERLERGRAGRKRPPRYIAGDETDPSRIIAGDYSRYIAGDDPDSPPAVHVHLKDTFNGTPSQSLAQQKVSVIEREADEQDFGKRLTRGAA